MPYLEILAPAASTTAKRVFAQAATDAVVRGFGVEPSTVTLYFVPFAADDYAHEGVLGAPASGSRVFVKVHAYRRGVDQRRAVAAALTPALAACFDTTPQQVAVYFLDRAPDEVAHEGHMASDEAIHHPSTP
jgi:phenylpyruvate tautomerase PptA (4-oxalocrotonate tautomerase family)